MITSSSVPPDYVEVTGEASLLVAEAVATCDRIRALHAADREANMQLKRIAEGTKFPYGKSPYYRQGFDWRNRIA